MPHPPWVALLALGGTLREPATSRDTHSGNGPGSRDERGDDEQTDLELGHANAPQRGGNIGRSLNKVLPPAAQPHPQFV